MQERVTEQKLNGSSLGSLLSLRGQYLEDLVNINLQNDPTSYKRTRKDIGRIGKYIKIRLAEYVA
jgi:hypothetical protein